MNAAAPTTAPASRARYVAYGRAAAFGLVIGYVLSRLGVADYDEIDKMLRLDDARLWLIFAVTVALSGAGFHLLGRAGRTFVKNPIHRGTVAGGLLFGLGWTFTGACPSVVLVQVGEGRVLALASAAGMLLGTWLYGRVHARYFRWDQGSCDF